MHGIELVRGLVISVEDAGAGYHLLAYEPDPDNHDLQDMLARSIEARDSRIPLMVEKIAVLVPALRLEDVLEIVGTAVLGRPHLADALVRVGASADRRAAFAQYLLRAARPTSRLGRHRSSTRSASFALPAESL